MKLHRFVIRKEMVFFSPLTEFEVRRTMHGLLKRNLHRQRSATGKVALKGSFKGQRFRVSIVSVKGTHWITSDIRIRGHVEEMKEGTLISVQQSYPGVLMAFLPLYATLILRVTGVFPTEPDFLKLILFVIVMTTAVIVINVRKGRTALELFFGTYFHANMVGERR